MSGICPLKPYVSVCNERPDLRFPASCDRYGCEICGPRKARHKAALMTWALRHAPDRRRRLVTLTLLPQTADGRLDWQAARWQVRDLARRVRVGGYRCEWSWAIEQNPKRTGFHAHACQWGDYIPQRLLQDLWGGRRVDIRSVGRPADGVYAIKEAVRVAGYTVKHGTEDFGGLAEHLRINGGRAAHFSRGFLHGLTAREAAQALALEMRGGEVLTWHLEPAWTSPATTS